MLAREASLGGACYIVSIYICSLFGNDLGKIGMANLRFDSLHYKTSTP